MAPALLGAVLANDPTTAVLTIAVVLFGFQIAIGNIQTLPSDYFGGGAVGMETAYWLSYEHGCRITVIDMLGNFMDGACTANRGHIIHYLEDNGAKLVNCATIKSFEPGRVLVSRNISKGAPDVYCTWTPVLPKNVVNPLAPKMGPETVVEEHHAELFVNALGRRADESQYLEGVKQHVAKEIYNIGDSFQAGLVWGATKAAYNLAQYI